jgi:hypothetical protein
MNLYILNLSYTILSNKVCLPDCGLLKKKKKKKFKKYYKNYY